MNINIKWKSGKFNNLILKNSEADIFKECAFIVEDLWIQCVHFTYKKNIFSLKFQFFGLNFLSFLLDFNFFLLKQIQLFFIEK